PRHAAHVQRLGRERSAPGPRLDPRLGEALPRLRGAARAAHGLERAALHARQRPDQGRGRDAGCVLPAQLPLRVRRGRRRAGNLGVWRVLHRHDRARPALRHPVPPREKPGARPRHAAQLRGALGMLKTRLIAVLILRDGRVVQSVRFKHTNAIHYDPIHAMECFNKWAIDEIVMLNVSRDAASRDAFADAVHAVSSSCFVPLAAGGWITEDAYAARLLLSGADKLVLNTALADDPEFVTRLSRRYGAQCIVASMDVKRDDSGTDTVVVDRAIRAVSSDPAGCARRAESLGAG